MSSPPAPSSRTSGTAVPQTPWESPTAGSSRPCWPSLVRGYVQGCRALMITAILLGFLGLFLGILGLRCTTIGGMDLSRKAKLAAIAGALHILAGQSGNCPVPDVKSSERGLRDGSHLLVRRQHHAGLLQPPLRWNQVRAGPCPLPGLERLPALHPGWHLPRLHLLLCLPGGPHCKGPASLQSFRSFCSRDARHDLGRR
ncbi:claudin-15 isoform X5 [Sciurus carolinensis]|uniref:claudin-15 isoform X5 n=1 Tax=Sciurus carolinensis TaxID=30640 RepID=UPI001FB2ED1F|nr:claudin-15 isoform X5 [Sciurus carolinensis]